MKRKAPAAIYAIASDYSPSDPGIVDWARKRILDTVFQRATNDLVVPTDSVFGETAPDISQSLKSINSHSVLDQTYGIAAISRMSSFRTTLKCGSKVILVLAPSKFSLAESICECCGDVAGGKNASLTFMIVPGPTLDSEPGETTFSDAQP